MKVQLVMMVVVALFVVNARADSFVEQGAKFPSNVNAGRAATVGTMVYYIGGWSGCDCTPDRAIYAYDSVNDSLTTRNAVLPESFLITGAVPMPNGLIYLFGDHNVDPGASFSMLTYDPKRDEVTTIQASPTPDAAPLKLVGITQMGPTNILIVGGILGTASTSNVFTFDTTTNTFTHVTDLPAPMVDVTPAWDGHDTVYLFGGFPDAQRCVQQPLREYHVSTGTVTENSSLMNNVSGEASAPAGVAWDALTGQIVLVAGNECPPSDGSGVTPAIGVQVFDPPTLTLTTLDLKQSRGLGLASGQLAVTTSNDLFFIQDSNTTVERVVLTPAAPTNMNAQASSRGVALSWLPKPGSYDGHLIKYAVYRGVGAGAVSLAATVANTSWLDTGCPVTSTCTYKVTAWNEHGEGQPSQSVVALGAAQCANLEGVQSCLGKVAGK